MSIDAIEAQIKKIDSGEWEGSLHEIAYVFQKARDYYDANGQTDLGAKMDWEWQALRLMPQMMSGDGASTTFEPNVEYGDGSIWPDVSSFTDEQWEYLAERITSVRSPYLISHYSDLIWTFRQKYQQALRALEAYALLEANILPTEQDLGRQPEWVLALIRPIELAKQINDQQRLSSAIDRLFQRLHHIRDKQRVDGSIIHLLDIMSHRRNLFTEGERVQLVAILLDLADLVNSNPRFERAILESALRLRTGSDPNISRNELHRSIAATFQDEAEIERPGSGLIAVDLLGRAIAELAKLEGEDASSEVEELQATRASILGSPTFDDQFASVSVDLKIDLKPLDSFLNSLRELAIPAVFAPAVLVVQSMPDLEQVVKEVEVKKASDPLRFLIPHQPIEPNSVVESEARTEEEIFNFYVRSTIRMRRIYSSVLVTRCIERLGSEQCNEQAVNSALDSGELVARDRLPSIHEAIAHYFGGRMRTAITLLTLECEPLLREALRTIGLSPVTRSSQANAKLQRVKYLHECLAVPELEKLLGTQWIMAAKSLLTEDGGDKLRHLVAHGRSIDHLVKQETADILVALLLWVACYSKGSASERNEGQGA